MQKTVAVNEAGSRIGEDHPNARYTDGEVAMVLALRDEGMSYRKIARLVEMPKSTVAMICRGERRCQTPNGWRRVHVPGAK